MFVAQRCAPHGSIFYRNSLPSRMRINLVKPCIRAASPLKIWCEGGVDRGIKAKGSKEELSASDDRANVNLDAIYTVQILPVDMLEEEKLQAGDSRDEQSVSDSEAAASLSAESLTDMHEKVLNRKSTNPLKTDKTAQLCIPQLADGVSIQSNAEVSGNLNIRLDVKRTIGVDFGDRRTGIAVTYKGFSPRILMVSDRQRKELVSVVVGCAVKEGADEIILGLPRSWDYMATKQTEKVLKFGVFLATEAARNGVRVYLFDEFKSSKHAMTLMINLGQNKRTRREKLDAYAAMSILESYFESNGKGAILLPPVEPPLQQKLVQKFEKILLKE